MHDIQNGPTGIWVASLFIVHISQGFIQRRMPCNIPIQQPDLLVRKENMEDVGLSKDEKVLKNKE